MTETFNKVLIKDSRIGEITDAVKYAVFKSAQNITSMSYQAISATNSAHVFNVALPSLETVIDRTVLWSSTVTLKITGNINPADNASNKTPGMMLINYGVTDALSSFPLHSLVATMTATINNNTVAMNVADVLPAILRMMDPEELAYYNDMTPTTLDYLSDYADGVDRMTNQLAISTADPRPVILTPANAVNVPGALPAAALTNVNFPATTTGTAAQKFISYPNNVLSYDYGRPAGTGKQHRPRGSFEILEIYSRDGGGAKRQPIMADNEVYVRFRVSEPLLLSPFTFGTTEGKQGFYGIQTLNFQMNMLSNANRAWRSARFPGRAANSDFVKTAQIESFENSQLTFQFLTPHASELLPSSNVVPYYEMPVYRTTGVSEAIVARGAGMLNANGEFPVPRSFTINSSNIQLSGIPDKLIIFVRRSLGNLTCCDSDSYLTINNIRINFNNQAGLLSSMNQHQLYMNSVLSGLNNMSFDEFKGTTISVAGRDVGISAPLEPYSGFGATNGRAGIKQIPTTGSILVLNFGEVIQLTDEYYAPGSLGTFNLQLQLEVINNHKVNWAANEVELVIIPINSGCFVNERGTSSTFISLLTKQDVLSSLEQQAYSSSEVKRMVGGSSFMSNLRNHLGNIWQKVKDSGVINHMGTAAKTMLASTGNPYGTAASAALGALGYGRGPHRAVGDRVA